MNQKLTNKLIEEFPGYFRNINKNITESCMFWGICVNDGWFDIIYSACAAIKKLGGDSHFQFGQIKEKYGSLRLYCHGGPEGIWDIIDAAERESYGTCEYCGSKDNVTSEGGWITTLCKECRNGGIII
jgi:hypothetical protein